jgi:hypothetical protein
MHETLATIEVWSRRLEGHRFFQSLQRQEPDLRRAVAFAPTGTFWVMTFQDILRLNVALARDATIRRTLAQHQVEDSGHQEWFLEDLRTAFGDEPTRIRWLFSDANRKVRDLSLELASEVFRIADDRLRLVMVEVLEAAAGTFFGNISRFLSRSGHASKLKYLAGVHIDAEEGHELHGDEQRADLEAMELPPELCAEAERMVARMFEAFFRLADAFSEQAEVYLAPLTAPMSDATF